MGRRSVLQNELLTNSDIAELLAEAEIKVSLWTSSLLRVAAARV